MSNNNDLTVGRVYSTTMNHPSGITEVLLEKTQRELDEALKRVKDCGSHMIQVCKELEAGEMDCAIDAAIMVMGKLKQAEMERDHYRQSLEEISTSVDDWLNSLIQEPSLDFIHAIKAWADKKLKENI